MTSSKHNYKNKKQSIRKSVRVKQTVGDTSERKRPIGENYINRELSWLEFNKRVVHQIVSEKIPLLEKLRFCSIFVSNLDEFCMKRIGGLKDQIKSKHVITSIDNRTPGEQLSTIRDEIIKQTEFFASMYESHIFPALHDNDIMMLKFKDLNPKEKSFAKKYFEANIFPILTPLAVDFGHPFPFVSNLSKSLAICMRRPHSKEKIFARVKIPDEVGSWIHVNPDSKGPYRFLNIDDLVKHSLGQLFTGMKIENVMLFRVTRSASWNEDDEDAEDLLELVEEAIKERKFSTVVRLEHEKDPDPWLLSYLQNEMGLHDNDIYEMPCEASYSNFDEIIDVDRPDLKFRPWNPRVPLDLLDDQANIFQIIKRKDLLVNHPYHCFTASVERLIRSAAEDPNVLAIKITLYRTDKSSKIIDSLIYAAENGKQVACVIELKARFDEERNIIWAQKLINAGVHVVHGMVGLKTHSKMALIVRKENEGITSYAHIGTGNYNSRTSKLYTDLSLFTCDKSICNEILEAFNFLTGFSLKTNYNELLIAPINMKERFIEMIKREASYGEKGRIVAKMNQLEDADIIDALYEASQKGAQIDLIVRGFCCLKPGVQGLSENIRVISIVGRFLEHPRIYYFGKGQNSALKGDFYIGSADWMYRNLQNRVEVITPIKEKELKRYLLLILESQLTDDVQGWEMKSDGSYVLKKSLRAPTKKALSSQDFMINMTLLQQKSLNSNQV